MAYKFRRVIAKSNNHLLQEILDFLVNDVGMTDETPAGQDDELGAALGYFLRSDGEDGQKDLCFHLKHIQNMSAPPGRPQMSYLTTDITTTTQMSCTVHVGARFTSTPPFPIRIDDELIMVSSVVSNTLNFSQRGIQGTTKAAHSTGAQVLNTRTQIGCEVFAMRDFDNPIRATAAPAVVDYATATIAEFAGEGTDRFKYGYTLLKDRTTGKMRIVYEYNTATGQFDYADFKDYPGSTNVDLFVAGQFPCFSRRAQGYWGNSIYQTGIENLISQDPYDSWAHIEQPDAFLYGSKDGFFVILKTRQTYYPHYFGVYTPFANTAKTTLKTDVAAATTSIEVNDRRLFIEGEKFRIISKDAQDWVDNEDRSGEGWPDLDPEEGVSEEFVVSTITPGAGNEGTLVLSAPLRYSYRAGAKPAIIGEDPQPIVRSICYTQWSSGTGGYGHLFGGRDWYGAVVAFLPGPKDNLTGHASHRQSWRVLHVSGSPHSPRNNVNEDVARFMEVYYEFNPHGKFDTLMPGMNQNYVINRNMFFAPGIRNWQRNYNYESTGIFHSFRGTIPGIWMAPDQDWIPGNVEDTFYARWLGAYKKFRLFKSYSYWESYTTERYFVVGPEDA